MNELVRWCTVEDLFPKKRLKTDSVRAHLSILTTSASRMLRRTCSTGISPAYPAPQPKVLERSFPVPRGRMVTLGINWSWPWQENVKSYRLLTWHREVVAQKERGKQCYTVRLRKDWRQPHFTFSFMLSMASSTQPTVPSPPHTSTRTLPGGSRVHSWRALEGASSDRSNTWRRNDRHSESCSVQIVNSALTAKQMTTTVSVKGWFHVNKWRKRSRRTDLHRIQNGAEFSQQSLPHVVAAARVSQDQNRSPATATGRRQLQKHTHTHTSGLLKTHLGRCLNPVHRAPWSYPQHLAVLFRVSAAELVDVVEVVRRDDEAVELAQVTLVCICQAVHAVIVHCGLTPHTPGGGTEARKPIRKAI